MTPTRLARWLLLGAGTMDAATGLGLSLAPAATLALMGVVPPDGDALVFLRWVGAFVGAVGATYLWGWLHARRLLRPVLELTMIFRLAAGVFSAVAIARGWLTPAWLSVPVTDLALVGAQVVLLAKGAGDHD